MLKILNKIFGTKQEKDLKKYENLVEAIHQAHKHIETLSHDELRAKTSEFRTQIKEYLIELDQEIEQTKQEATNTNVEEKEALFNQIDELREERDQLQEEILEKILPEAFAVVKETATRFAANTEIRVRATDHDRELAVTKDFVRIDGEEAVYQNSWKAGGNTVTWDMIHYDVQLIGGMVLHEGKIAEMATGEGKTLVATLPAYLNGLTGNGVHVITVNDYLAKRDSEWVGPIFQFLMLTVDCLDRYKPHSPERHSAYRCDITYGTNNEFGFDYLRDNMVRSTQEVVQKKHHFCIIDEVDSVLIDDARTPLIISGPVPKDYEQQEYEALKPLVERLIREQKTQSTKYLNEAKQLIQSGSTGHEEGEGGLALLRAHRANPKTRPLIKFLSEEGMKKILQKAENYYMQEQNKHMHIVDEPLFYTIEEKTRAVELTEKGAELLSEGSQQNMFTLPDIAVELSSITNDESLQEDEKQKRRSELLQDYSAKSRRLHAISQLLKAYSLFEKDTDYVVMDGEVKIVDEQTGRMMEGRRYSDGLHQALEAKENVKIGEITQTYATITLQNYFRMYHKLSGMTGTAETEAGELWEIYKLDVVVIPTNRPITREDKDDLIYKTQREKIQAVIEEIERITQQGRPVLVGTTSVDISEMLSRMLALRKLPHNVLNAKQHQREAEIVAEAGQPAKITIATNMAGRGTDIKIGPEVKAAGGLAIIGTERHDSRRVDRQLRGRAGRQGDPGSSQFYVSMEDNLMRLFISERAAKLMNSLGQDEGEVMQHSMLTKSVERAQKKVEENNFGIRKRLLEYDDVMNIQREAIYKKRNHALSGERLSVDINSIFTGFSEGLVGSFSGNRDFAGFKKYLRAEIGFETKISETEFEQESNDVLSDRLHEEIRSFYDRKLEDIVQVVLPFITRIKENDGDKYKRIALPYGDGTSRVLQVSAELDAAVDTAGNSIKQDIEKTVSLALIDENWKEHLRAMDELKDSTQAASFEQKDPLVVYKMEAYELFEQLVFNINEEITSWLIKGRLMVDQNSNVEQAREQRTDMSNVKTSHQENGSNRLGSNARGGAQSSSAPKVETVVRAEQKIGRNDPCPCGSGKKYKQCHGKK